MLKGKDTRNNPEMPKRATPAIEIPDAPSLKQKRTRSFPAVVHTTCSALPEKTPVKDLLTQNRSPSRYEGAWRSSQGGYSHHQNGSSKKGISDPKGKLVGSTEVEQISSGKGTGRSLGNGNTPSFHSASSSSIASQQEAKAYPGLAAQYAKLHLCPDDVESILFYNDGDMLSPGKKLSEDPQAVEVEAQCVELRICSDDGESILLYSDGDTSSPEKTLSEDPQALEVVPYDPEGVEPLLPELMDDIIGRLPMLEVLQLRSELGKAFRNAILRPAFCRSRPHSEGEFSPSFFMTDAEGDLHWHGFDTNLRKWTRLPSLNFAKTILPSPDPDLFKDYLVAGDGGLLCINVGKASGREKLVICNPLTQQVKVLPPLKHPRHPVLMHLKVDHDSGHYRVFVAGSAAIGTDELSLKTEEYDSRNGVWECPDGSELPCPVYGLNEYQNGVYFKDLERELLMCVAIIDTSGRGVLVYDITKKKWAQGPHVKHLHIPLVRSEPNIVHVATTQIVECGGSVYVFSEQECGRDVYFLIHKLVPEGSGEFSWDEVMKRKRTGGRGLLVYPEFTCVPVSEHELCIFNTVEHTIEIIDLINPSEATPLQAPTCMGNKFHSLNPIGFVFKPSFRSVVCPSGRTLKVRKFWSECERRDSDSKGSRLHMNDDFKSPNLPAPIGMPQSSPVTVPANKTTATKNFVAYVGSPDKLPDRHHNQCAITDGESRPKSWDGVVHQFVVAAK